MGTLMTCASNNEQYTLIKRPVENIDVTDFKHIPQVNSPFSCVVSVSVECTLTSYKASISVQTIYGILTPIVITLIRPGMFLPRRFIQS